MATQEQVMDGNDTGGEHQPEMSAGNNKKKGSILAYFFLPGIIPEIKELTRGKFGYLAYLIAMIYQIVRILPKNHPYTKPKNIGKYGIAQVITTAANHIKLDRKNIDQVIVFTAVLAGLILMILQFVSLIFFLFMGNAWAGAPAESASLFTTENMQTDIAFYMIREVFGLPTMFGVLDNQTGLHLALHKLFEFYNLAILFVAVLIFVYYIVIVVGETAQTGVPFGQRFSHIYAPFRLVIAIGLLVPLNFGFNGAQYMAFYAAKLGSSLATNGWLRFNEALSGSNPLGVENATLIAQPNNPDLTGYVEFMSVAIACREAYEVKEVGWEGKKDLAIEEKLIKAYIVDNEGLPVIIGVASWTTIQGLLEAAKKKGHISVYFGKTLTGDDKHPGQSTPVCGEVKVPLQLPDMPLLNAVGNASPNKIQEAYFLLLVYMWVDNELNALGQRVAKGQAIGPPACDTPALPGPCGIRYLPPSSFKKIVIDRENVILSGLVEQVFIALRGQINYQISDEVLLTGWGGAGIWYSKIAQVNGAFVTTVMNIPNIEKRPIVMENTGDANQKNNDNSIDCKEYEPNLKNNKSTKQTNGQVDDYYARVLNETYQYWRCDKSGEASNFFWDSISAVFGLNGLFNIRQEAKVAGADGTLIRTKIHPLAKLSSVGKSLVESSVQNMGMAMASSFGGGILGVLAPQIGSGLAAASSMFVSIATIGLSIGFILYYILPFLPFMYFFFAVGGWVKGLFEAMVGTPLWALAHLRIDGDGLPGKSAMSGYLLVFEIFLRPILTVFGLIGGLAIFTAMASILDEVFDLVVNNVTGTDITPGNADGFGANDETFGRHLVDQFFFTIVYAIILYMMALSSFKMITLVPNNILRWLGQSVSSFNDQAQDPAQGLTQYAAMGGARIGGQLAGGISKLSEGGGSLIGELGRLGQGGMGAKK